MIDNMDWYARGYNDGYEVAMIDIAGRRNRERDEARQIARALYALLVAVEAHIEDDWEFSDDSKPDNWYAVWDNAQKGRAAVTKAWNERP